MQGNFRWINKVRDLLDIYNSRKHRTIKMSPNEVTKKDEEKLLQTVYNYPKIIVKSTKLKVGDFCRISKYKSIFEKGYTPNWGVEIFKIVKVNKLRPETYHIVDSEKKPILGAFYAYELQKVKHPEGYLVEKVLKKRGSKMFCKFLGFDKSHNDWVDASSVS